MKLYTPPKDSHKGQNGKLLIIGGSRDYQGAPMFSILAARRFVDLVYFYPGENDPSLINAVKTIPEAMVVYDFDNLEKMDCVLFGIGLSKAPFDKLELIVKNSKKLVIDGDGLKCVAGGSIPQGSILTPHEGEFRMLFGVEGSEKNVIAMAKKHKCVILKKGPIDIIADGRTQNTKLETNRIHNPGMTKGGTGDVLSGLLAALACKNDSFAAAVAAAKINGKAGNLLMKKYRYNFCASDLAEALAEVKQ
jgi:NAD(P)H-hydrate epimerase